MKKYLIYSMALMLSIPLFHSCSEEKLSDTSVITVDKGDETVFDKWLRQNYVKTYNIDFKYRYEDIQSDDKYYTVPAEYKQAVKMAHIVKYVCLEAFDEAAGINFTRANFPKMIYLIGDWEYNNNGTFILGTAEGGKKILLAGTNFIDSYITSEENLNHFYLKTIFHEFQHILNQTQDYSADFQQITGKGYVAGSWSDPPYDGKGDDANYPLHHGFISSYAQHSHQEDFAEMFSIYVTNTQAQWDSWLAVADEGNYNASQYIKAKLDVVRSYMREAWGIDIDELREIILRREADIVGNKIDLENLDI